MDIANSGKTKYVIYVNPELEKKFSSVETLYDVPKVKTMVKRKSRLQTNCLVTKVIVVRKSCGH